MTVVSKGDSFDRIRIWRRLFCVDCSEINYSRIRKIYESVGIFLPSNTKKFRRNIVNVRTMAYVGH